MAFCSSTHFGIFTIQMRWAYITICFLTEHSQLKTTHERWEKEEGVAYCTRRKRNLWRGVAGMQQIVGTFAYKARPAVTSGLLV
jgi:hypothetical protein